MYFLFSGMEFISYTFGHRHKGRYLMNYNNFHSKSVLYFTDLLPNLKILLIVRDPIGEGQKTIIGFTIICTSKLGLCRTLFSTISKWHWETKNLTRTQILMIWSWRRSRQDTSEDGKTQFGTQLCSWVTIPRSGRNLQMFIQRWGCDMICDHHDIYSTPINRYIYCSEPDIGCWRGWVDWEACQAVEWSRNISANSSLLHYKPFWFLRYF